MPAGRIQEIDHVDSPTIAPAVSIPATCPTTVPVSLRLLSRSLVTIGVTAASSAPGTMMASPAVIISKESLINARTANRKRRGGNGDAGNRQHRSEHISGRDAVRQTASSPRAHSDRRLSKSDDYGVRLQSEPEIGRQEPQRYELHNEHAC
jgi:hypothetical protein